MDFRPKEYPYFIAQAYFHTPLGLQKDIEELDFIGPFEVLSYINKIKPESTNVWLVSDERYVENIQQRN